MRYEWDTLRAGDAVFVHTDHGRLVAASVASVSHTDGKHHTVIVQSVDGDALWAPALADVHGDPVDIHEGCERCRQINAGDAPAAEAAR